MDWSLSERAKRFRRIAASIADEELTRKVKPVGRLAEAQSKADETAAAGKSLAAD